MYTTFSKKKVANVGDEIKVLTHGFKRIGNGFHADVYHKQNSLNVLRIDEGDEGYKTWVNVIQGCWNRYLPRVRKCKLVTDMGNNYFNTVYEIEYLTKIRLGSRAHIHCNRFLQVLKWYLLSPTDQYLQKLRPVHRELVLLLRNAQKLSGADFDLHSANIMKRGKHFVITDPLSDS